MVSDELARAYASSHAANPHADHERGATNFEVQLLSKLAKHVGLPALQPFLIGRGHWEAVMFLFERDEVLQYRQARRFLLEQELDL